MRSLLVTLVFLLGADKDDQPVSRGEYQYLIGGKRIGEEQFRIFKKKGYRIESTRTLYWPEPSRQEMKFELEASLEPKKLSLSTTRAGIVTELELNRKGDNWRAVVDGQGRDKKTQELGRRAGAVVDFDSLLFNAFAVKRLALVPGEAKNVDAVVLALPDFAGGRQSQTYRRVDDEEIETGFAGKLDAAVYELSAGNGKHRLWVAPSGVVLKGLFEESAGEREVRLVRLETRPGAWPP
jgi:hypothetical protein